MSISDSLIACNNIWDFESLLDTFGLKTRYSKEYEYSKGYNEIIMEKFLYDLSYCTTQSEYLRKLFHLGLEETCHEHLLSQAFREYLSKFHVTSIREMDITNRDVHAYAKGIYFIYCDTGMKQKMPAWFAKYWDDQIGFGSNVATNCCANCGKPKFHS